jgi:hypothetical protein
MSPVGEADDARWVRRAVFAFIVLAVAVGWSPRLCWGLWLDETFSAWQVEAGFRAITREKSGSPGQSVLFGYIEALFYFPRSPHFEAWLRVPAFLGGLACCFFAYRLAQLWLSERAGHLAALAMAASPQMLGFAAQARPYTLAVAACLASLWGLARWLETGARRHGFSFSLALALALHLHLLFSLFVIVPAFLVVRRAIGGRKVDWPGLVAWTGLAAVLTLPLVPMAKAVSDRADLLRLPLPGLRDLLFAAIPHTLFVCSASLLVLLPRARPDTLAALRDARMRPVLELATLWLLVPPLVLFAASHAGHQTVLVDRYFLYTVGGEVLLVALVFHGFPPVRATVAVMVCLLPIPLYFGFQAWTDGDGPTSWRRPFAAVTTLDPAAGAPVFIHSGHPLSNRMDWQHGVERRSFLFSPIVAYPVRNRLYPLPYAVDADMEAYVRRLAAGELAATPEIFLTGVLRHPTVEWVRRFFESRGYTSRYAVADSICLIVLRK